MDYSNQNLQNVSFKNRDLTNAVFSGSDLRGADFSGAMLVGANFNHSRTGITTDKVVALFLAALTVSLFSGYISMLAGHTLHQMLVSKDPRIHIVGIITIAVIAVFILSFYFKGGGKTIKHLTLPTCLIAMVIGVINYLTGFGTGMGMLYLVLTVFLVTVMIVIGTMSRASAGALSSTILFLTVAVAGGMFGKSIGGGIGAVIMALSCAQISKRVLSGAKGFDTLRKIAFLVTRKFGTSFKYATLTQADFADSKIHNTDFTEADVSLVNWEHSKIENCISGIDNFTIKQSSHV